MIKLAGTWHTAHVLVPTTHFFAVQVLLLGILPNLGAHMVRSGMVWVVCRALVAATKPTSLGSSVYHNILELGAAGAPPGYPPQSAASYGAFLLMCMVF